MISSSFFLLHAHQNTHMKLKMASKGLGLAKRVEMRLEADEREETWGLRMFKKGLNPKNEVLGSCHVHYAYAIHAQHMYPSPKYYKNSTMGYFATIFTHKGWKYNLPPI